MVSFKKSPSCQKKWTMNPCIFFESKYELFTLINHVNTNPNIKREQPFHFSKLDEKDATKNIKYEPYSYQSTTY